MVVLEHLVVHIFNFEIILQFKIIACFDMQVSPNQNRGTNDITITASASNKISLSLNLKFSMPRTSTTWPAWTDL